MRRDGLHTHPCSHCKTPVECSGDLKQNYDGWPEVVCVVYHIDGARPVCEACEDADKGEATL